MDRLVSPTHLRRFALLAIIGLYLHASPATSGTGFEGPHVDLGNTHTCAIAVGGSLHCWGYDLNGQVGDGPGFFGGPTPTAIPLPLLALGIHAGNDNSCALDYSRTLHCWGRADSGQMADGLFAPDRESPFAIPGLGGINFYELGGGHICAARVDGIEYCWGQGNSGQLGDGSTPAARSSFGPIADAATITTKQIASSTSATFALTTDGRVQAWGGHSSAGILGNGNLNAQRSVPGPVLVAAGTPLVNVQSIAAGELASACGITRIDMTSALWCWGDNTNGMYGLDPASVPALPFATEIAAFGNDIGSIALGSNFLCGIRLDRTVACMGNDESGQLGDGVVGNPSVRFTLSPVMGLPRPAIAIYAGGRHACAELDDQSLWCWGNDGAGQLGDGTEGGAQSTPTAVLGLLVQPTLLSDGFE